MKTPSLNFGLCVLAFVGCTQIAFAAKDSIVTSVYSSMRPGYSRERLADGSFKRETYVVGNGGAVAGTLATESNEDVPFATVVRLMAGHLARKNYFPAPDSKSADLLLVVSWGKTIPYNDAVGRAAADNLFSAMSNLAIANDGVNQSVARGEAQSGVDGIQSASRTVRDAASDVMESQLHQMQAFNVMRSRANEGNALLLGYMDEINGQNNATRFAGNGTYYDDLVSDVENERYYLIISAYDYHVAATEKKSKVLWVTRVSIQAQGNRFKTSLASMIANAGTQFGQKSGRLIRQYHQGRVDLGELKFLETVPDSASLAPPAHEK